MPMLQTDVLALCECCALLIANGDESGCRDYYGHTHQSADVPVHAVLKDEWAFTQTEWTCDGCNEPQAMFSTRRWADVLEPKHAHGYRFDISDWWCHDCQAVTDFCQQINPH